MESCDIPSNVYQLASEWRPIRVDGNTKKSSNLVKEPVQDNEDPIYNVEGLFQDSIKASSSETVQDSPVSQISDRGGRQPLHRRRNNDISSDGLITARQQMIKSGGGVRRLDNMDKPPGNRRHSRVGPHDAHTCAACSTSFPNNYQLEEHTTKNNHRAYLCACGKSFFKLFSLRRHINDAMLSRRGYPCPLCDLNYRRQAQIERHLRLIHKMQNDVIEDLLSTIIWQQGQDPGEVITAAAASTSTLISDVSLETTTPLQNDQGSDRVSDEKESALASSSFGMEPEWPQQFRENAKRDDNEEDIRSDHESCADETISVQSYADSVFDAGSVGSSASSVYSDTQALVGEYVDFLARDPGLEKLFMRSMLPTVLGPERFRRNYSRILQSYARDLKRQLSIWNEPKMPLRTQGLAFISRRSVTMKTASIIASRYMEKAPRSPFRPGRTEGRNSEILGGDETSSGEESPENESVHTFVISELGQYFREGAPFQRMKRNLRNLVIPSTLLSRVKASTERVLDLVLGDDYLRFLLFKVLSDPLVPVRGDQFDPEIEIRYFGSSLRAEANSPDHLRMAEFIETYAGYIGTRAAHRMEGMNMEAILQDPWVSTDVLKPYSVPSHPNWFIWCKY